MLLYCLSGVFIEFGFFIVVEFFIEKFEFFKDTGIGLYRFIMCCERQFDLQKCIFVAPKKVQCFPWLCIYLYFSAVLFYSRGNPPQ